MFRKLLLSAIVAVAAVTAPISTGTAQQAQQAQQAPHQTVVITPQRAVQPTSSLALPLNKSQTLRVSETVTRITVGNADIVDAAVLSDHAFYVLGKQVGTTNISVFGQNNRLLAVVDVVVGTDVEGVKAAFHAMMPNDNVEVRAINDSIALSGTLPSPAKVAQAMDIARRFADKDKVINNLRVTGTQQVMLQVKVAEMQRNVSKSFGFKPFATIGGKPNSATNPTGFSLSTIDPVN